MDEKFIDIKDIELERSTKDYNIGKIIKTLVDKDIIEKGGGHNMAAGFTMLEAGLVRSKNVTTQLTKNMGLFSLAAVFYYLIGYNLMYPGLCSQSLAVALKINC